MFLIILAALLLVVALGLGTTLKILWWALIIWAVVVIVGFIVGTNRR